MIRVVGLVVCVAQLSFGQSYAPAPGFPGSTAIHKDSAVFVEWAIGATVTRGPINIQQPGLGNATYGVETDALGIADGEGVVSLGDGGEAVITFQSPIMDGLGYDFAIFENGFVDHYMEFAFVEVSSDGVNFVRFDAVSEIQTITQLSNFSLSNCAMVNNLAGKYRQYYGTPFDLSELSGAPGLNVNLVTHIKLVDVVGSIDPLYGSYDSEGGVINDPYPTEFESCGFDLDAIGVINSAIQNVSGYVDENTAVFPNPFEDLIHIESNDDSNVILTDSQGSLVLEGRLFNKGTIDTRDLSPGIYFIQILKEDEMIQKKLIKQ